MEKPKILIVDDEEALLMALRRLFNGPRYEVETADSLDSAKECLDKKTYDIVMTDLRLGDPTNREGMDVIIYARQKNPAAKIILWTAYGNPSIEEEALKSGAHYYFEKPISPKKIGEIIQSELNAAAS